MRYLKILGLLTMAAAAMMVVVSSASATTLTKEAAQAVGVGQVITAETEEDVEHSKGNKHAILTGPVGIEVTCNGSAQIEVTGAGSPTTTVEGNLKNVVFNNCTNGIVVHVSATAGINGTGTLHTDPETGNGKDGNGTLTVSGATVTITNIPGVQDCGYQSGSKLGVGTLTGAPNATAHATLDITVAVARHSGNAFCGASGTWEGKYTVTSPAGLRVDHA